MRASSYLRHEIESIAAVEGEHALSLMMLLAFSAGP